MKLAWSVLLIGSLVASADAQPTTSPSAPQPSAPVPAAKAPTPAPVKPGPLALPAVGDELLIAGMPWPKLDWLYDVPSANDSAGKVIIHWFCAPRIQACTDDLARIVTLKEAGKVYVVAYINGTKAQAKKLDPIRESEGVGRGTVAYGAKVTKVMKGLKIAGPASIVVGVDGKVQLVTTAATPADLDARDAKVNAAIATIKDYTSVTDGPKVVKPGERFPLAITITLASWLKYSDKSPTELKLTMPPDIKCDPTALTRAQMKIDDKQLTAAVTCSGPHGIYEGRGELRFGYDAPGGGAGIGAESVKWKFEIK